MRIASLGQLHLFKGRRQKPEAPPIASEFRLACAFADTLRRCARKDWIWTHVGHGENREAITGARLRRMGQAKGWPDYLFVSPEGQLHCLELKRRGTGRLTDEQAQFRDWCLKHGVPWQMADTYDVAIATVSKWGILRMEVRPQ